MTITKEALKQKALFEMKEFAIIALYLWIVLALFLLYKSVLLNEEHISYLTQGMAIINALVLGKIILIAKALHLGDNFNNMPAIYPTIFKSALFAAVLAVFKLLEAFIISLIHGQSFQTAIADFGGGTAKGILTLTFLMFVVLIPFFGFGELQRVLGEGQIAKIFFGPRALKGVPDVAR
ncbi:MAG TPA: hypothetical protein VEJ17_00855 [Candidatus Nitrosotalea sp.]|nr:hypothetical protein [Candidatus Nitrosotalea sp.]